MTETRITLVHSPALGPSSWTPVAAELSARGHVCVVPSLLDATSLGEHLTCARTWVLDGDAILVAHSGAGPLLPAIHPGAAGYVFVDAGVPNEREPTPLVPEQFLVQLGALADGGVLPPWSDWFGTETFDALVPDRATRDALRSEMRRMPLDFYRASVVNPVTWGARPCGYVRLSAAYRLEAAEARQRGWPVRELDGTHLDLVTRPAHVAAAIDELVGSFP